MVTPNEVNGAVGGFLALFSRKSAVLAVEMNPLSLYNWRDFGYVWLAVVHAWRGKSIEKFLMIGRG